MTIFLKFPNGFLWGAATASYQVEGGINNNDWSVAAKQGKVPEAGDSCDHYNLFEEDFGLAKSMGHNCSRISIEWSRIEPKEGQFDEKEIEHYRRVLKTMHEKGLKPFVTLWHFTLPKWFSDKGGFERYDSPEIFSRYCAYVASQLDDLSDNFSTMNEPLVFMSNGYWQKNWPPFKRNFLLSERVFNNLVKAHNLSYQKIKNNNKNLNINFVKHNVSFVSDRKPWNKFLKFVSQYYWNHRFFKKTAGNFDSIGLNYYFHRQFGVDKKYPKSDMGWNLVPEGLYRVLMELKKYQKPIYVTEAGLADEKDSYRAGYIAGLIQSVHRAIEDGLDVRGFMYWSLLDNFEWAFGYWPRFGLIEIDYQTKKRTIRNSAYIYKKICEDNQLTIK